MGLCASLRAYSQGRLAPLRPKIIVDTFMKRIFHLSIISLTLLGLALSAKAAAALTPQEVVARIQAQYDKSGGFKAWFRQESRLKGSTQGDAAEGWMYFKKPLQMRWQYENPPAQKKEVISDGKQVWMYLPQDQLAMVYPLNQVMRSDLVMRFFSGIGQINEEFKISWQRPPKEGADYAIELAPRQPQMELKALTLTIDPQTYQVKRFEFTNALEEETRFAFTRIQMDYQASPGFFTFTPPPGVQVVKEGQTAR
jgi:outer membrane lipoprotein carrier protein